MSFSTRPPFTDIIFALIGIGLRSSAGIFSIFTVLTIVTSELEIMTTNISGGFGTTV